MRGWLLVGLLSVGCGSAVEAPAACETPHGVYEWRYERVDGDCGDIAPVRRAVPDMSVSGCNSAGDLVEGDDVTTLVCSGLKCDAMVSRATCSGTYRVTLVR